MTVDRTFFWHGIFGLALAIPLTCHADDSLWFDPAFFTTSRGEIADLSRFSHAGAQAAGNYVVDIRLNGQQIDNRSVRFIVRPADLSATSAATSGAGGNNLISVLDNTGLLACVSIKDLQDMGVRLSATSGLPPVSVERDECAPLGKLIPQAWTAFDFQKMRLDISIPQAALDHTPLGWVDPKRWDQGINAGMLTYRFNGSNTTGAYSSSSRYLSLDSGINLGRWHLRDTRNWSDYGSMQFNHHNWQRVRTYAQRAFVDWRSDLTLGDTNTGGDIFESFGFTGAMLASDDTMYPYSLRGYAPTVRGVANTNAQVSVRQNGYLIYQTNVSPGAFVINDLNPGSTGGDLQVTVTEADGRLRNWTVPYASVPILRRQGSIRYEISAGRYRTEQSGSSHPSLAQGTFLWGLPHDLTAYGGLQYTSRYLAATAGLGINMGKAGALSLDVTHAGSRLVDDSQHQGWSLRFLYSHSFDALGSSFQMTGYRYTTAGFYTLSDTTLSNMQGWQVPDNQIDTEGRPPSQAAFDWHDLYRKRRERLQINVSQRLGNFGYIYLTDSHESYWNSNASTDSMQLGFSGSYRRASFSLTFNNTRQLQQHGDDREIQMTVSIPLALPSSRHGSISANHPMYSTFHSRRNNQGDISWGAGVSGTALTDSSLTWALSQGHDADGESADASLGLQGRYGDATVGYSYSSDYKRNIYGFSGGVVMHRHGITFGQPLADTNILIAAPGASGLTVQGAPGVKTDRHGYAVVPYAEPYEENRVALAAGNLAIDTDVVDPVHLVVPTRGALVSTKFVTHTGARALLTLTHDTTPLPFGARVSSDSSSGIVSDDGEVYLSGLASTGTLRAEWGDRPDQQCQARYALPPETAKMLIVRMALSCDSSPDAAHPIAPEQQRDN